MNKTKKNKLLKSVEVQIVLISSLLKFYWLSLKKPFVFIGCRSDSLLILLVVSVDELSYRQEIFVQNSMHLSWRRVLSPTAKKLFTPTALVLLANFYINLVFVSASL